MKELRKPRAMLLEVGEESVGQRVDNFLLRHLKGVPKSHVYRVLRSGEVRVNSGRVQPGQRLQSGDRVRLPPVRLPRVSDKPAPRSLELPVLHEDGQILVLDKPSGVAVHGGSGVSHGVIESLRAARPKERFLELAHRLDRDTSGLLVVAKRRGALTELHRMLRDGEVEKRYLALVRGVWRDDERELHARLHKYVTAGGERRVRVREDGQAAITRVRPLAVCGEASLLGLQLLTGRTHQIRVHLAHEGFPVLGDDKYGDFETNRAWAKRGVRRLMLHAHELRFRHPVTLAALDFRAPLPADLAHLAGALFPDWSPGHG